MANIYDVVIIGSGAAGSMIAAKMAEKHKNIKCLLLDSGPQPAKRRPQLSGFLGSMLFSDAKLYLNDLKNVEEISGIKKTKIHYKYVYDYMSEICNMKIIKDKSLPLNVDKKIKKNGYSYIKNDYIQLYPKDLHNLSKHMVKTFDLGKNITYGFDNQCLDIVREKSNYKLITEEGDIFAKKIVLGVGRSGWRFANKIFKQFGMIESNDVAKFGIRVEMNAEYMKEFGKSNATIIKDGVTVGPFSWFGSVLPEDQSDMAISNFRSNETRWKSDKISFNLIGERLFKGEGSEQTDRMGRLTFLLFEDRVRKEKISTLMNKKSKLSVMKEYDWLIDEVNALNSIMPNLLSRAYFHAPTIIPTVPIINLGSNFESDMPGMFVAGEVANIPGILGSLITGSIVCDGISK